MRVPTNNDNSIHTWKFFRAGGFDQLRLESGADLMALDQLDQKLWVALACPTRGLEFDTKTLDLIDADKDGRIRAPEMIAATKWACGCLKNPGDLLESAPSLPLSAINDATAEGKQLLASARQILANLGKQDATVISVGDTTDTTRIFAQTVFNGDGIVPADAAEETATRTVIADIIACLGADIDRSGKPGVNQSRVEQFFSEAQAFSEWWKRAEGDAGVFPLGMGTTDGYLTLGTVRAKVDDYFARCRLAAFDPRSLTAMNRQEAEYLALAAKDLTVTAAEIAGFPLTRIEAGKPLPLREGINPAWADALAKFQSSVVRPLLGDKSALTETEWAAITTGFAAYERWQTGKAGVAVEKLGLERVREILAGNGRERIGELIAQDKALEPEANAIAAVDKLVRYHRDLYKLLNNFVSFRDFYRRKDKAVFQVGTLYLDQRSCDLCVKVEDAGKHAALAGLAKTYLAYCDLTRKNTGEKMTIAAAFTDGDSDHLMVGRNGIFYDRQGRDWDATIIRIVDQPISIRQAFWAPYKKVVRLIEEQIAKRAAGADAASTEKLAAAALATEKAVVTGKEQKPRLDSGVIAALGVAAAGISGMIGGLVGAFLGLGMWMPLGVLGVLMLISGPSMMLAWLKLRQRNLGPILDANGWAVNARARINIPFGASLTSVAKLPPGAQRDLLDPFADEKNPWKLWLILLTVAVIAFAWWQGKLDKYSPVKIRSTTVLGTNAPAYQPRPATSSQSITNTTTPANPPK